MKRSRAPRMLLILLLATGLLGLTLYVAYRLATRKSGALTTDGDAMDEAAETAAAEGSADVVDARQRQASAAPAPATQAAPSAALTDADLESMSREDLYALAEAVGVPARNRLTMTRAQLAQTLAEMRDQVTATTR
jgi:hypothetical protein